MKLFDDTFASLKYKNSHQVTGKPSFGVAEVHHCRKVVNLLAEEKDIAKSNTGLFTPHSAKKARNSLKQSTKSLARDTISKNNDLTTTAGNLTFYGNSVNQ